MKMSHAPPATCIWAVCEENQVEDEPAHIAIR